MAFVNSFKAPVTDAIDLSECLKIPYDINSCIPVPPILETERVQLVPFIPALHAQLFYDVYAKHPEISRYLPVEWPTFDSLLKFTEVNIRTDPTSVLFTIIDKTKPKQSDEIPGQIAGLIGWLHASARTLSAEIGPVIILPEFQRSFVATNATGLLLQYFLDLPTQGGLGFRRVFWCANPFNEPSVNAAKKMGFVQEGVMRWTWVLSDGKEGKPVDGKRGTGPGRDSAILSICWDDWDGGVRDSLQKRMDRV
ncbi:acyl-CoA N-acyltransferase [Agrocybe pediades]|nr:acyl-CoA N-acyltransferase [Agrocybe pediades]